MDSEQFDALVRALGITGSRRSAVRRLAIALITFGGAPPAVVEARRSDHRRPDQPHQTDTYRGISIVFDNTAGSQTFLVEAGEGTGANCCRPDVHRFVIRAGQHRVFDTTRHIGWVWITTGRPGERYWFQFTNPMDLFFRRPFVSIALDGTLPSNNPACCAYPVGRYVEIKRPMSQGETRSYNIDGAVFTVRRHSDKPRYHFFTVTPPPAR